MKLTAAARGLRYDQAIRDALAGAGREVSVREVRRALRAGALLVDGRARAPGERSQGGEQVELGAFTPRLEAVVAGEPELLDRVVVLHEDAALLALAKPSGMPTAPLRPGERGTLLGAAIARAPGIAAAGPPLEGGLVHRLDVGTSGAVLFAKRSSVRAELRAAFSRGAIGKRYLALIWDPERAFARSRRLEGWIGPGAGRDRVRVVAPGTEGALAARTEVTPLARYGEDLAWVEARASTGRRHQIRAHLAAARAPIVGDPIYGADVPGRSAVLGRLGLHAAELSLPSGLVVSAPVEGELAAVIDSLR